MEIEFIKFLLIYFTFSPTSPSKQLIICYILGTIPSKKIEQEICPEAQYPMFLDGD